MKRYVPKVTIVIPVYNGKNFLGEAIESALAQDYSNIEVIVVNDGSTDEDPRDYIFPYLNYIQYYEKPNGGVASALNYAIKRMDGDFFSWLSHDDVYFPEKISSQVKFLEEIKSSRAIIYSNYLTYHQESGDSAVEVMDGVNPNYFRTWLFTKGNLHGNTLLIPRQAFKELGLFNENLRTTQDYNLWFRFGRYFKFHHLNKCLVKFRVHIGQDSNRLKTIAFEECNSLYAEAFQDLTIDEITQGNSKGIVSGVRQIINSLEERGFKEAAQNIRDVIEVDTNETVKRDRFKFAKGFRRG